VGMKALLGNWFNVPRLGPMKAPAARPIVDMDQPKDDEGMFLANFGK
jgi:hypothetical protein